MRAFYSKYRMWIASFALSAAFLTILLIKLTLLQKSYDPDETQLTDDRSVIHYLEDHFTSHKKDKSFLVPTGVFISSISWLDAHSFYISGYVWQKYGNNYPKDLPKGFILPEAVELEQVATYEEKNENFTTMGWRFEGKITQRFDYSRYPLDNKIVMLRLWPKSFNNKVALVPDFSGYESTKSTDKFGLDPEIALAGYTILETFFRYRQPSYDTNFGLAGNEEDNPELYFNVVLKRQTIDAIIIYILPLIVVFILCFCTILSNTLNEKRREIYDFSYLQILTQCAALFFVVLLSHIHLREVFEGVGIVFLDYMYVLAYMSVVYVTINAFLVVHAELSNKVAYRIVKYQDNIVSKILFLPLFSVLALGVGLIYF